MSQHKNNENGTILINILDKSFHVSRGVNNDFWALVANNAWESHTFKILSRFLDEEHSYIDIGAWIGPTILYAAQISRMVYGVEPDPIAYRELVTNLKINSTLSSRVALFNGCIADKSGKVLLGNHAEGGDSKSSLIFDQGKTKWTVDGLTFDSFIKQYSVENCNFVKIDIEGGEHIVLPTMRRYLRKHRPTVYLSLHPVFWGRTQNSEPVRRLIRFARTLTILKSLSSYKHIYDVQGNRVSRMYILLFSTLPINYEVVFTDLRWEGGMRSSTHKTISAVLFRRLKTHTNRLKQRFQ